MISHTTARFRDAFARLPPLIQRQARDAYRLFPHNSAHPSLRFRQVHPIRPIYSAQINRDYRAVAIRNNDEMVWFWVGAHDAYERLLTQL